MNITRYKLLKADLLGNDDDGYEYNDSYDYGTYTLDPEVFDAQNDKELIDHLVFEGVFDKQIYRADSIEIDIQSDGIAEIFYFDIYFNLNAPRSRESFELRPLY